MATTLLNQAVQLTRNNPGMLKKVPLVKKLPNGTTIQIKDITPENSKCNVFQRTVTRIRNGKSESFTSEYSKEKESCSVELLYKHISLPWASVYIHSSEPVPRLSCGNNNVKLYSSIDIPKKQTNLYGIGKNSSNLLCSPANKENAMILSAADSNKIKNAVLKSEEDLNNALKETGVIS